MDATDAAIDRNIIAHERGWTPTRIVELGGCGGLGGASTLEYRRVERHEQVDASCWSVTAGWQISLRDEMGDVLISDGDAYPGGPTYPGDDEIRAACRRLIASWRGILARRAARREAATAFTATVANLSPEVRIMRAAPEIEAGRLAIAETAIALGVTQQQIDTELDRRADERQRAEDEAADDAYYAANPLTDDEYDQMRLTTAEELAKRPGSRYATAAAVRKQLSRAGVPAVDYTGRYRTARYDRDDAEQALSGNH